MRILLIILWTSFIACQSSRPTERNLSPERFSEAIGSQEIQLIDLRTPAECATGMIPEAVAMDYLADGWEEKILNLNPEQPVYLYCQSGGRSAKALDYLSAQGYHDIHHLVGGMKAWVEAGFKSEIP